MKKKGLTKVKIAIDPGHGGKDSGAVGYGLQEKDITLAIGLKLSEILKLNGQNVIMTRETDRYLEVSSVRTPVADLSISIHVNAGGGRGLETWVALYNRPAESKNLGRAIQDNILKELPFIDRGLKTGKGIGNVDYLYMLRAAKGVPVLVEAGFIDNAADAIILKSKSNLDKIAKGIATGIIKYLEKEAGDVEPTKVFYKEKVLEGFLRDGKTYVEVRKLVEAFGKKVHWDNVKKVVEVKD